MLGRLMSHMPQKRLCRGYDDPFSTCSQIPSENHDFSAVPKHLYKRVACEGIPVNRDDCAIRNPVSNVTFALVEQGNRLTCHAVTLGCHMCNIIHTTSVSRT